MPADTPTHFEFYHAYTLQEALAGLRMHNIHHRGKFAEEWQKEMFHNFDLSEMTVTHLARTPTKAGKYTLVSKPVAKLGDFYPQS
jgi:hypothetical protein